MRDNRVKQATEAFFQDNQTLINWVNEQPKALPITLKPIDRRTKISGAQWLKENVPQVLAHRCAYLNGSI